eukprot:8822671-Alexandrium_andersonii.AAC.1
MVADHTGSSLLMPQASLVVIRPRTLPRGCGDNKLNTLVWLNMTERQCVHLLRATAMRRTSKCNTARMHGIQARQVRQECAAQR